MLETLPPSRTLTADEVVVILARGSSGLSARSSLADWDSELDMLSYPALTAAEAGRHLIKTLFKIELSSAEARTAFRSLDKRLPSMVRSPAGPSCMVSRASSMLAARYGVPLTEVDTARVDKPGGVRVEGWA